MYRPVAVPNVFSAMVLLLIGDQGVGIVVWVTSLASGERGAAVASAGRSGGDSNRSQWGPTSCGKYIFPL